MKFNFSRRTFWFRLLPVVLVSWLVPLTVTAADSIFKNTGTITGNPPDVDAINFYNSGTWQIGTITPYTTADTMNYTNVGTMLGSVGWEFDLGPTASGQRTITSSFLNDTRGTIQALDSYILNPNTYVGTWQVSHLWVSATNIVNKGALIAGGAGEIVLTGTNVNLSRSSVRITPVAATGSANNFINTNFAPDTAIYDEEWQQTSTFPNGTPYRFSSLGIWDGTSALSPFFYFNGICVESNAATQLGPIANLADSTNIVASYTNIIITNMDLSVSSNLIPAHVFRQAVFVGVNDSSIIPADRFYPDSQDISNLFQAITVQLSSPGGTLYLEDTLGSLTNRGELRDTSVNIGNNPKAPCVDPTFRPANYTLSRLDPGTFANGSTGLGPPATNFLFDPSFTNDIVQAEYAAYHAFVDDLARDPLNASLTNLPGRIVINAGNLDLTHATLTSAGAYIAIHADNLVGSTGAEISCQNVSFNLSVTNSPGTVNVTNLIDNSPIPALHGDVYAWSTVWTNSMMTVFTNWSGTNTASLTNNVFTNFTEMDFHVLMVDGTRLSSAVPVRIVDLILQTNAIIGDLMNVERTFFFNGTTLTVNGSLALSAAYNPNWNRSLAPNLLYFTNNGTLTISQDAHFGDDGTTPYAAFVNGNTGTINVGGSETIDSVFYQSGGNQDAGGGYFVTTVTGKVENATIISGGDMDFSANSLKVDNSALSVGNQLNFTVTGSLYDTGGSANNSLTTGDGFNLWVKPATGDLLGTAITSQGFNGAEVDTVWAGEDRGASAAGYVNNVALGQLILSPQGISAFPPLFSFSGAGGNNAMYVDMLDLSQISSNDLAESLQMNNITIYYAAAKLSFTPPLRNGVAQEPEEYLNGMFGGHLQWVSGFAGPNSSVDVIINGQTYAVNRALRYSKLIDSNNNGIPNYYDPNPFNSPPSGSVLQLVLSLAMMPPAGQTGTNTVQTTQVSGPHVATLSWLAMPNTAYQLQYKTNLVSGTWQPLLNYTNTASTNQVITVQDSNSTAGQRFYRVSRP